MKRVVKKIEKQNNNTINTFYVPIGRKIEQNEIFDLIVDDYSTYKFNDDYSEFDETISEDDTTQSNEQSNDTFDIICNYNNIKFDIRKSINFTNSTTFGEITGKPQNKTNICEVDDIFPELKFVDNYTGKQEQKSVKEITIDGVKTSTYIEFYKQPEFIKKGIELINTLSHQEKAYEYVTNEIFAKNDSINLWDNKEYHYRTEISQDGTSSFINRYYNNGTMNGDPNVSESGDSPIYILVVGTDIENLLSSDGTGGEMSDKSKGVVNDININIYLKEIDDKDKKFENNNDPIDDDNKRDGIKLSFYKNEFDILFKVTDDSESTEIDINKKNSQYIESVRNLSEDDFVNIKAIKNLANISSFLTEYNDKGGKYIQYSKPLQIYYKYVDIDGEIHYFKTDFKLIIRTNNIVWKGFNSLENKIFVRRLRGDVSQNQGQDDYNNNSENKTRLVFYIEAGTELNSKNIRPIYVDDYTCEEYDAFKLFFKTPENKLIDIQNITKYDNSLQVFKNIISTDISEDIYLKNNETEEFPLVLNFENKQLDYTNVRYLKIIQKIDLLAWSGLVTTNYNRIDTNTNKILAPLNGKTKKTSNENDEEVNNSILKRKTKKTNLYYENFDDSTQSFDKENYIEYQYNGDYEGLFNSDIYVDNDIYVIPIGTLFNKICKYPIPSGNRNILYGADETDMISNDGDSDIGMDLSNIVNLSEISNNENLIKNVNEININYGEKIYDYSLTGIKGNILNQYHRFDIRFKVGDEYKDIEEISFYDNNQLLNNADESDPYDIYIHYNYRTFKTDKKLKYIRYIYDIDWKGFNLSHKYSTGLKVVNDKIPLIKKGTNIYYYYLCPYGEDWVLTTDGPKKLTNIDDEIVENQYGSKKYRSKNILYGSDNDVNNEFYSYQYIQDDLQVYSYYFPDKVVERRIKLSSYPDNDLYYLPIFKGSKNIVSVDFDNIDTTDIPENIIEWDYKLYYRDDDNWTTDTLYSSKYNDMISIEPSPNHKECAITVNYIPTYTLQTKNMEISSGNNTDNDSDSEEIPLGESLSKLRKNSQILDIQDYDDSDDIIFGANSTMTFSFGNYNGQTISTTETTVDNIKITQLTINNYRIITPIDLTIKINNSTPNNNDLIFEINNSNLLGIVKVSNGIFKLYYIKNYSSVNNNTIIGGNTNDEIILTVKYKDEITQKIKLNLSLAPIPIVTTGENQTKYYIYNSYFKDKTDTSDNPVQKYSTTLNKEYTGSKKGIDYNTTGYTDIDKSIFYKVVTTSGTITTEPTPTNKYISSDNNIIIMESGGNLNAFTINKFGKTSIIIIRDYTIDYSTATGNTEIKTPSIAKLDLIINYNTTSITLSNIPNNTYTIEDAIDKGNYSNDNLKFGISYDDQNNVNGYTAPKLQDCRVSSSNTNVVKYLENGKFKICGKGISIITINYPGDNYNNPSTNSFTFTIKKLYVYISLLGDKNGNTDNVDFGKIDPLSFNEESNYMKYKLIYKDGSEVTYNEFNTNYYNYLNFSKSGKNIDIFDIENGIVDEYHCISINPTNTTLDYDSEYTGNITLTCNFSEEEENLVYNENNSFNKNIFSINLKTKAKTVEPTNIMPIVDIIKQLKEQEKTIAEKPENVQIPLPVYIILTANIKKEYVNNEKFFINNKYFERSPWQDSNINYTETIDGNEENMSDIRLSSKYAKNFLIILKDGENPIKEDFKSLEKTNLVEIEDFIQEVNIKKDSYLYYIKIGTYLDLSEKINYNLENYDIFGTLINNVTLYNDKDIKGKNLDFCKSYEDKNDGYELYYKLPDDNDGDLSNDFVELISSVKNLTDENIYKINDSGTYILDENNNKQYNDTYKDPLDLYIKYNYRFFKTKHQVKFIGKNEDFPNLIKLGKEPSNQTNENINNGDIPNQEPSTDPIENQEP